MEYRVLKSALTIETSRGTFTFYQGQKVTLPEDIASRFLNEGKIKPFCFWLNTDAEDCQYPCVHGQEGKIIKECEHFKTYWNKIKTEWKF